jgi:hypothetical protein
MTQHIFMPVRQLNCSWALHLKNAVDKNAVMKKTQIAVQKRIDEIGLQI